MKTINYTATSVLFVSMTLSMVSTASDKVIVVPLNESSSASTSKAQIFHSTDVYMVANGTSYTMAGMNQVDGRARILATRDGVFKNMYIYSNNVPASGSVVTGTLQIDTGSGMTDTSLTVTQQNSDGKGPISDTVNSVSISAGTFFRIKLEETGGVNSGANHTVVFEFE